MLSLRQLKLATLEVAERTGFSAALRNSPWRRDRLAILCWHGFSLDDEHHWNPGLYVTGDHLRRRLGILRQLGCNVLSLDEGVRRLYEGTLPPRSVVLTVDDGSYDFYLRGWPVFREFGYPVTLYFTTWYSDFNRPVFDTMCSYLLWKAGGRNERCMLHWPEVSGEDADLADEVQRERAGDNIRQYALGARLSGRAKDELLAELAVRIGIDYEELCRRRVLHLVTSDEAHAMAAQGLDVQYHTHRHRVFREKDLFHAELTDNLQRILPVTGKQPRHFCYTAGFHLPEFPGFLREYGVVSATTCEQGLCTRESDPMLLPRVLDQSGMTELEYRGWLSGTASFLPRRHHSAPASQLMDASWRNQGQTGCATPSGQRP